MDNPEWQDMANKFMWWAWDNLHSGQYPQVQQYLAERGFSDYFTDIWRLGYNPRDWRWNWGGIQVFVPQGIVIPWIDSKDYVYKLNIRRDKPTKSKYLQIKGGANWLFNSHRIKAESIVVLVEGELDAISVSVGYRHHRIVPVATGSSTGARWLRWAALLSSAYRVLIAFDDDDAGEFATQWWAQYLPNCRRLLPEMKDCNEMLINHYPFQQWIQMDRH
ncbi:MAG: toprim domain-containing protein [Chloroflexota bacterium]